MRRNAGRYGRRRTLAIGAASLRATLFPCTTGGMDSVSQFVLGAAVSAAALGPRTKAWRSVLWGGVIATLPDLDVLIDHGDAVKNMTFHRAESHSLLYLTLLTPLLAWAIARLHGERALLARWCVAVWLALVTHPLLDAMTIYGTQLLLPFSDHPFAVGSLFVIDPLYTLPLLCGVVLAWRRGDLGGLRWNLRLLAWSTAYLMWSLVAQAWAITQVQRDLQRQGITPSALLVTPAPFTTVLWRVVAVQDDRYLEGYYALLDGDRPLRWSAHSRGSALLVSQAHHPHVQRMLRFTDGLLRLRLQDDHLWLTDLRMGQEGAYVFDFDLGPPLQVGQTAPAAVQDSNRPPVGQSLRWLWARMGGADLAPLDVREASRSSNP